MMDDATHQAADPITTYVKLAGHLRPLSRLPLSPVSPDLPEIFQEFGAVGSLLSPLVIHAHLTDTKGVSLIIEQARVLTASLSRNRCVIDL